MRPGAARSGQLHDHFEGVGRFDDELLDETGRAQIRFGRGEQRAIGLGKPYHCPRDGSLQRPLLALLLDLAEHGRGEFQRASGVRIFPASRIEQFSGVGPRRGMNRSWPPPRPHLFGDERQEMYAATPTALRTARRSRTRPSGPWSP